MKKIITTFFMSGMLIFGTAGCASQTSNPETKITSPQDASITDAQAHSYRDVEHIKVEGNTCDIEIRPGSGDDVIIHSDTLEGETITSEKGTLAFSIPENAANKSTIVIEVPDTCDTISVQTTSGNICIGSVRYSKLGVDSVDGDITSAGIVGAVMAQTTNGEIDSDLSEAVEADGCITLDTVIAGAQHEYVNAGFYTENGQITVK